MTERDRVYLQLLHIGLVRLRDAACMGRVEYCAMEAEHLHNIPSLIGESNERRHEYYFEKERPYYLERVDRSIPGIDLLLRQYEKLWQQLETMNASA